MSGALLFTVAKGLIAAGDKRRRGPNQMARKLNDHPCAPRFETSNLAVTSVLQ